MKKFLTALVWAVVILGAGFFVYKTFVLGPKKAKVTNAQDRLVPVAVTPVSLSSISEILEISGEIGANKSVVVKSKVSGRLEQLRTVSDTGGGIIPVKECLRVKKGQQIAVIDHDEYFTRVRSAEAAVAVAKAGLKSAIITLEDARKEKVRWVNLSKKGFASEQKADKAVANYDRALAANALAKARVKEAQAALDLAKIQFNESTIFSPITGVVTHKHIDEGNMVDKKTPIVTVEDIEMVKIKVGVPERYLKMIKPGMTPASIKVDAFPEKKFQAEVVTIYPWVDKQTRTLQVELRVVNDENLLKPGMFARVFFTLAHKDNTLVVHRDTVLGQEGGERYVYIVNSMKAHRMPVELGLKQGARVEVVKGLKAGDRLVTNGMNYLREGYEVEIVGEEVKK